MASIDASTSGAGGVITTADASGILNLQTASTTAVTINASQNVGIGTTSPTNRLDVSGAIRVNNGGSANYLIFDGGTTSQLQQNSNTLFFNVNADSATNGSFIWRSSSSNTERMRIDSSGNVLVGNAGLISGTTSSPRLYVVGATPIVDSGGGGQQLIVTSSETSGGNNGGVIGLAGPSAASGVNIKATIAGKYDSAVGGNAGYMQFATLGSAGDLVERMRIDSNGNVGIGITPTNASLLQLAAGTTAKAPLELTSGPVKTTAEGGAFEYLTNVGYFTPTNNNRAVIATEHFVARTGTKTMTSNTALQSIFGGGTGGLTNGALTVDAATSYYFECLISITSMSATGGNFGFSIVGAGTATFTSAGFFTVGYDNAALTNPASGGGIYNATAAITTNIIPSQTGTGAAALIKGIFRINGGGTIIPSIQLTTAAAAVIGADSWFKCYPVGTNTVVSVGNWS